MSWKTIAYLGLVFVSTVTCNASIDGGDPNQLPDCPPGMTCTEPKPEPPTVVRAGPGGGAPFDPVGDGSSGVVLDPNGNVVLDPRGGTTMAQSIIWIANSSDGSISKIDTRTLKQLARYVTCPGGKCDPSRTTVSLNGDVVVANRAWQNGALHENASAVFIAGEKGGCVDRNGNGRIDTYEGEGVAVPAQFQWAAGQAKSPDECVVWLTQLDKDRNGNVPSTEGTRPRAAGFDANPGELELARYVYIGLFDAKELVRLDIRTGAIVKRIDVSPTAPYGLVLDKNGNVWIAGREAGNGTLTKVAVNNNDAIKSYDAQGCNYGITSDARGYIYMSWEKCVARFNPVEEKMETLSVSGAGRLRGLAIDNKNQLWVADDQLGMHHIDASPSPRAGGGASTMVYKRLVDTRVAGATTNNVGAAIDFDNKPWTISQSDRATKIEPSTYSTMANLSVRGSYTYSDMTGYQLRNASRAGVFRHTFTGCDGQTTWTTLSFDLQAPGGTKATIRYRAAATRADLMNAQWVSVMGQSPVPIMLPPGIDARFLQVEVNMVSVDGSVTPVLSGLSAVFTCKNILG